MESVCDTCGELAPTSEPNSAPALALTMTAISRRIGLASRAATPTQAAATAANGAARANNDGPSHNASVTNSPKPFNKCAVAAYIATASVITNGVTTTPITAETPTRRQH